LGPQQDGVARAAGEPCKPPVPAQVQELGDTSVEPDETPFADLLAGLLHRDVVPPADLTAAQHRGVDPDVGLVVLGCGAQDSRVLG